MGWYAQALDAGHPSHAPDGSRIVIEEGPHLEQNIVVMDADGSNMTPPTDYEGRDVSLFQDAPT